MEFRPSLRACHVRKVNENILVQISHFRVLDNEQTIKASDEELATIYLACEQAHIWEKLRESEPALTSVIFSLPPSNRRNEISPLI